HGHHQHDTVHPNASRKDPHLPARSRRHSLDARDRSGRLVGARTFPRTLSVEDEVLQPLKASGASSPLPEASRIASTREREKAGVPQDIVNPGNLGIKRLFGKTGAAPLKCLFSQAFRVTLYCHLKPTSRPIKCAIVGTFLRAQPTQGRYNAPDRSRAE